MFGESNGGGCWGISSRWDPVGTVARLRELDADVRIVGNTDRYVLTDSGPFPPASELTLTPELVDQMTIIAAVPTGSSSGFLAPVAPAP